MVRLDMIEANRRECRMNVLLPDPASLFQAIERLYKLADMVWTSHFKSLWLHHVQSTIEIGMRNAHRAKLKVFQGSQSKNNANGGVANCGSKGLLQIKCQGTENSPW